MRVLDLGIWRPVPYATQLLAAQGAEVVKVEPPHGDPMRGFPELFDALNAGKRTVVLDLKSDAGRREALALAAESDVVAEGFRPGVASRLGVGWDDVRAVNDRVVYCSVVGHAIGHDINYQAEAGVLGLDDDPRTPRIPWADLVGGLYAAFAITAACVRSHASGTGERVVVDMTRVLAEWVATCGGAAVEGVDEPVTAAPGYGVFPTVDGHIAVGIVTEDGFWRRLCETLRLDELASLTFAERLPRAGELHTRLERALRSFTRDDAVARLTAAGVPVAPVRRLDEIRSDRA